MIERALRTAVVSFGATRLHSVLLYSRPSASDATLPPSRHEVSTSMGPIELARWQWSDYADFHQNRVSMVLHLISVPLFWLGLLFLASWAWHHSLALLVLGLVAIPVAFAMQGAGHKREENAPKPFTSPVNAIARLVTEQLVTFPRYLVSGQILRVLQRR